jgi:hypothetical protein
VDWWRNPLVKASAVVVPVAVLGYGIAALATGKVEDALLTATTALVFGAFFGGLVKLWLDDFQRARDARGQQVQFVTNVLADLKSVYDRVERARILIEAHASARTYGDEMSEIIDANVQLRNVIRALDQGTGTLLKERGPELRAAVRQMEAYLSSLTSEFKDCYRDIAYKQRADESDAWADIAKLPQLQGLRGYYAGRNRNGEDTGDGIYEGPYGQDFVGPLELATWILRSELRSLRGEREMDMPGKLAQVHARFAPSDRPAN